MGPSPPQGRETPHGRGSGPAQQRQQLQHGQTMLRDLFLIDE